MSDQTMAVCPRCDRAVPEGPTKDPWVCEACCAESAGMIWVTLPLEVNGRLAATLSEGGQLFTEPSARHALRMWVAGLERAVNGVRNVLTALESMTVAEATVAVVMGVDEPVVQCQVSKPHALVVAGLLPHIARRLVTDFDLASGPRLSDAELLKLMETER